MTTHPIRMRMYILWLLAVLWLAGCTQPPTPTLPLSPSPTVEPEREIATLTVQNEPTPTPEPEPETNDIQINITFPTAGATLRGKVDIEGSVVHPNLKAYGIVYTTDRYHTQNSAWRLDDPIAWNVETSITDGVLGTWNTTDYPNGSYSLLLAVYEMGVDEPLVYFVDNLTIENETTPPRRPCLYPPLPLCLSSRRTALRSTTRLP